MLQTHRVRTLDQVRSFLAGAEPVEVQPLDRTARYEFVAQTLRRFTLSSGHLLCTMVRGPPKRGNSTPRTPDLTIALVAYML